MLEGKCTVSSTFSITTNNAPGNILVDSHIRTQPRIQLLGAGDPNIWERIVLKRQQPPTLISLGPDHYVSVRE
jgi:hypothetical protein